MRIWEFLFGDVYFGDEIFINGRASRKLFLLPPLCVNADSTLLIHLIHPPAPLGTSYSGITEVSGVTPPERPDTLRDTLKWG
jgi:hypothetical protein